MLLVNLAVNLKLKSWDSTFLMKLKCKILKKKGLNEVTDCLNFPPLMLCINFEEVRLVEKIEKCLMVR